METQNIEYKVKWKDEFLKEICAFANTQGGTLYIGIDDSGHVEGVTDAKNLLENLPNKVRDTMGILVNVKHERREEKDIVSVSVEPSSVPISLNSQYYIRSGSTKQELRGTALQEFILKKMGKQWDDVYHDTATIDCIDPKAIAYFIKRSIAAKRLTSETTGDTPQEVLENLRLVSDDGKLKYAAILLFAKDPLRYFTGVQFKIGRFGEDEADLRSQDIVEGNILQMADRVIEILKNKYLHSYIRYDGMQRIEELEIPEDAFREILYNAIVHKQYTGAPIQMRIFEDHIELWNEGNLPENYTVETLMHKHASKPRNLNIASVFYKAGFIEAWGRGYKKIQDGFIEAKLPVPVFATTFGGIEVNIARPRAIESGGQNGGQNAAQLTERQQLILTTIEKHGGHVGGQNGGQKAGLNNEDLAKLLGISLRTIEREVVVLKKKNLIKRIGYGLKGYWAII